MFYRRGQFVGNNYSAIGEINWLSSYNPSTPISGTNASSINPSIAQGYYSSLDPIQLVYQQGTSSIQYKKLTPSGSGYIIASSLNVSSGDGNANVRNPSIIAVSSTNTARISYVGNHAGYDKVTFKDPDNMGSLWRFGVYTLSTSIGINNSDNGYIVSWTENGGYNKYTRNSTLGGTILQFKISGQVIPGNSFSDMYGAALNTQANPYRIKRSDNIQTLGKETDAGTFAGRQGIVSKDDAQFYFTFGDVLVDGEKIDFEEKPDSIQIDGLKTLNSYLITKPFTLNSNSEFLYDVEYGFVDSLQYLKALGKKENVNFKVQLVDNNNGKVIGEYDNVSFTPANVLQYNNVGYQVNTEGMQRKTVRLRLVVSTSLDAKYSLAQCFNTEPVTGLGKNGESRKQIHYKGADIVTDYALSQNYPNPFNPTTTISYALPKDGMVTLKIYDALGREVRTLVNEQKTMGRYSVEFDASTLASGMYVDKIAAVPMDGGKKDVYTSVKKMMLLK